MITERGRVFDIPIKQLFVAVGGPGYGSDFALFARHASRSLLLLGGPASLQAGLWGCNSSPDALSAYCTHLLLLQGVTALLNASCSLWSSHRPAATIVSDGDRCNTFPCTGASNVHFSTRESYGLLTTVVQTVVPLSLYPAGQTALCVQSS